MAIIKKGILGGFKGKAGAVVGYRLMDQDIMRGVPEFRSSKPTKKEEANRWKFKTSQTWLQPLTEVLRVGFEGYKLNCHGFNGAKSFISCNAVHGVDPFYYVDPALACISHGKLYAGTGLKAEITAEKNVLFSWDKEGPFANNDRAIAVAYDINDHSAIYDIALAKRSTGMATLELAEYLPGAEVHMYLGFITEDRKERSISQYLGMFLIL
ncbi:DUF6266 family protein [Pedobacter sp. JCM 36344]|uniref:DUF6266 family protein n=1 Tax=Pedobacter sp. JCM 36344 TaxID=3374280 RepID=UPI00397CC771